MPTPTDCRHCGRPYYGAAGMLCRECKKEAERPADAADCSRWVGKLTHDRSGYSDWGWLRDEAGELIVIVKIPPMTDEEINQHRRAGTDPAQARVDVILAAINGRNATVEPAAVPRTETK